MSGEPKAGGPEKEPEQEPDEKRERPWIRASSFSGRRTGPAGRARQTGSFRDLKVLQSLEFSYGFQMIEWFGKLSIYFHQGTAPGGNHLTWLPREMILKVKKTTVSVTTLE